MKTRLLTLSLIWLTAYSAQAQTYHVKPIILLPDSTEAYQVTRPWLVFALRRIQTASLQEFVIDGLEDEVVAAEDQLYYRDMTIKNFEVDNERLTALLDVNELQREQYEIQVQVLEDAYRRARLWRNLGGAGMVAFGVLLLIK